MAISDETDLIRALKGLDRPAPSADLMARMANDAAAESTLREDLAALPGPVPSDLLMARILRDARAAAPGRWVRDVAAWSGLAAAAVAGLMIGFADPGGRIAGALPAGPDYGLADLAPGYDFEMLSED